MNNEKRVISGQHSAVSGRSYDDDGQVRDGDGCPCDGNGHTCYGAGHPHEDEPSSRLNMHIRGRNVHCRVKNILIPSPECPSPLLGTAIAAARTSADAAGMSPPSPERGPLY